MPLAPKQRDWLERFYPGLVAAAEQLGAGEFEPNPPKVKPLGDGIRHADLRLKYTLADKMVVDVRLQLALVKGAQPYVPPGPLDLAAWKFAYYSHNYGQALGDARFRFDFSPSKGGPHVHLEPDIKKHVSAAEVEPNTENIDPRTFIAMVANLRTNNVYPVKRKRR